jgi:hypothetical protein
MGAARSPAWTESAVSADTDVVVDRSRRLTRAILVLVCAVGLVGMHQMAAAAHPVGHHTTAMAPEVVHEHVTADHMAHHCPETGMSMVSASWPVMDHRCAAVPSTQWSPHPTGTGPFVVPSPPRAGSPLATRCSGADPPDLNALSVSRT